MGPLSQPATGALVYEVFQPQRDSPWLDLKPDRRNSLSTSLALTYREVMLLFPCCHYLCYLDVALIVNCPFHGYLMAQVLFGQLLVV